MEVAVGICVAQAVQELLPSDSEEDVEEEEEDIFLLNNIAATLQRNERVCVQNYSKLTVPLLLDDDFQRHFRMSRSTFESVLGHIQHFQDFAVDEMQGGRQAVPVYKQLQILLWTLDNQESFQQITDCFDVSPPTAHTILCRMVHVFCRVVGPAVIAWPNADRLDDTLAFQDQVRRKLSRDSWWI